MKFARVALAVAVGMAACCWFATTAPAQETKGAKPLAEGLRVGSYDSRAIAVAFAASDIFKRELADIQTEHKAAKAEGNEARVKEIEASMQSRQQVFHRQGFGTAPVDDILENISADEMAAIAKAAGVDVIVSKWNITYAVPGAALVDVTDQLVAPFHPNERTLQTIKELRGKQPLSRDELNKMGRN